jgi:hypothetical protein
MEQKDSSVENIPPPPYLGQGGTDTQDSDQQRLGAKLKEWNSLLEDVRTVRAADISNGRSVLAASVANDRSVEAASVADERSRAAASVANDRSVEAASVANERSRVAADRLAGSGAIAAIIQGYISVCETSMTNALSRGTFITTAAGAIGTVYTGLLGLRYSVANSEPLTLAAGIPGIFLGIAILTSATYVAFLKQGETAPLRLFRRDNDDLATLFDRSGEIELLEWRIDKFANWTYGNLRNKSAFLYTSVYSLAYAVALLPISFVKLNGTAEAIILVAGLAALVIAFGAHRLFAKSRAVRAGA